MQPNLIPNSFAFLVGVAVALPPLAFAQDATYADALVAKSETAELWKEPAWRKLGHYRLKWWGRRSQADGQDFFADDHGNASPRKELDATIRAMFAPPVVPTESDPDAQHPQCRWRARYQWIHDVLDVDDARLPPVACPRYDEWRSRLDVDSVTLIYADAYLGNPASMFGHTFLRLNRNLGGVEGSSLVSNTVEFAAVPWTTNPLLYPILGLGGGFAGHYSTAPYYLKVRQYTSMEDRDLWEYPMLLDEVEEDRLMAHLWEMGHVPFMYYYLKENCSYHLLGQMEVARNELELLDRFPFIAFPISTVRAVIDQEGLVGPGALRPSAWRRLSSARRDLSKEQRALAVDLARDATPAELASLATLSPSEAAATLDAAVDLLRYRRGDAVANDSGKATEDVLLRARGLLAVPSAPVLPISRKPPESGHRAAMVAVSGGASESGSFARLTVRPALHDLLARPDGYVDGSALEMMGITLRAQPQPYLERLGVFATTSILPLRAWRVRPSWRVAITGATDRTGGCVGYEGCFGWTGSGGLGTGLATREHELLSLGVYGFVDGVVQTAKDEGWSFGPRAALGVLAHTGPLRWMAEADANLPLVHVRGPEWIVPDPVPTMDAGVSLTFNPHAELRTTGKLGDGFAEADVGAVVYW